MAELNGPAYERVEGASLEVIVEAITERQLKYLKLEYLLIPRVNNVKIPNSDEYSRQPAKKQPVRYLMPEPRTAIGNSHGYCTCTRFSQRFCVHARI